MPHAEPILVWVHAMALALPAFAIHISAELDPLWCIHPCPYTGVHHVQFPVPCEAGQTHVSRYNGTVVFVVLF